MIASNKLKLQVYPIKIKRFCDYLFYQNIKVREQKIIIHRGTHTIGGSCIEINSGNHRIILDLGMPLMDRDGAELNQATIKNPSIENGIMPEVEGLQTYQSSSPQLNHFCNFVFLYICMDRCRKKGISDKYKRVILTILFLKYRWRSLKIWYWRRYIIRSTGYLILEQYLSLWNQNK